MVVGKPMTVKADAIMAAAACYIIASIALSLGFSVATNHPNWGNACLDIYNDYIGPTGKTAIDNFVEMSKTMPSGLRYYCMLAEWEVDAWEDITTGIINYCNDSALSSSMVTVTPGSSGKVGFTSDSTFSWSFDHNFEYNESITVNLGQSIMRFTYGNKSYLQADYIECDPVPDIDHPVSFVELVVSDNIKYVWAYHKYRSDEPWRSGAYRSYNYTRNDIASDGLHFDNPNFGDFYFFQRNDNSSPIRGGFYLNGVYHTIEQTNNNKYAYVNYYNNSVFNNMYFDSYNDAVVWFCDAAGLAVRVGTNDNTDSTPAYNPSVDSPITGDTTAAQNKANDVADNARATDSPISTSIPASEPMLDVLAENPAVILDPAQAPALNIPVKPVDLPDIDTGSPQLWTTKFPFCLPFDIARLITDFSAEPQIPVLDLLVMPSNCFGMQNEDIYVTIDFTPFDNIVKILRFFISIAFVFFLIKITRKLIS